MACVCEANADHSVDAGSHRLSGPWRLKKILIQRVYRRALACCNEADVDHAVVAGLHRLAGRKKRYPEGISTGDGQLQRAGARTRRRRMPTPPKPAFSGLGRPGQTLFRGYIDGRWPAGARPTPLLRALEAEEISYPEGISTGVGMLPRGHGPFRPARPPWRTSATTSWPRLSYN